MRSGESTVKLELLSLTYGAMVAEIVRNNNNDVNQINSKLLDLGAKVGERMVDEFLAYGNNEPCSSVKDVAERLSKALRTFLNVSSECIPDQKARTILVRLHENPLENYIILPDTLKDLQYSNVIMGAIKGALEAVNVSVGVEFLKDRLKNRDDPDEIRVTLRNKEEIKDLRDYQQ